MSSTSIGRQAENEAANYLAKLGFNIIEQNWRTRWCEIDIVATKNQSLYFVEVKYRRSNNWGSGIDYITPKKLQQMEFAATFWVSTNKWSGDYLLSVIEVSGNQLRVTDWIEDVTK